MLPSDWGTAGSVFCRSLWNLCVVVVSCCECACVPCVGRIVIASRLIWLANQLNKPAWSVFHWLGSYKALAFFEAFFDIVVCIVVCMFNEQYTQWSTLWRNVLSASLSHSHTRFVFLTDPSTPIQKCKVTCNVYNTVLFYSYSNWNIYLYSRTFWRR